MNDQTNILEINESEFEDKVIKASHSSLILVDFWAPWCGPCKQLTPILEKIVNASKGKTNLIKIDIDSNQQIASQLRIQSIPAVFAFKDGQPVDAFQGVMPENKIIEFIEKSLGEKLKKDNTNFYQDIEGLFNEKKYEEAQDMLEEFIANDSEDFKIISLYIDCLGYLSKYKEAETFIDSLNKDSSNNENIKSSIQKIMIKKQNTSSPSLEELINKLHIDPNNINNISNLADKYFAEDAYEEAFELVFNSYKKNNDFFKKKLLKYFETLGINNKITIKYRKKLSSIIFS